MTEKHFCLEHSGCVAKIENLKREVGTLETSTTSAHKRIDGMKNWVIAGMTSLILQLLLMLIGIAVISAKNNETEHPQNYQRSYSYDPKNHPAFPVK